MSNLLNFLPILAIAISTISLLSTLKHYKDVDSQKIWDALNTNTTDIALLKKQGELFWGLAEQQLAKALIRPTHIELDRLLEKLVRGEELSPAQERRLLEMLKEIVDDKNEVAGIRAMSATILAIRLARQETAKGDDKPCD